MLSQEIENQNRRRALVVSVGIHVAVFALLFFLVVFRPPDPPITMSMYGVEVDFGVDDEGSGEIRSLAPANTNPPNPDARDGAPEESEPEPRPESSPSPPPTEPTPEEPPLTADDEESPVEVNEPPKIERPVLRKEEPRPEPPPSSTPPAPEQKPEEVKKVNPSALFTKKNGAGGTEGGTSDKLAGNNNGDDEGKVGDKGDPRSKMTSNNFEGDPGSGGGSGGGTGGGFTSDVNGWKPNFSSFEKDPSDESGKIVFQIRVNDEGVVVTVVPIESTVSPRVVEFYRQQLLNKKKYNPRDEDTDPAPVTPGRVEIRVRTN
jgi:outer membrane biosynthesis protein TonB